jgi:crotonobetaine/carnitine-CoA ligase
VPGEFGEEEVLVAVVPGPGASIDPLEMIRFLVPRLPYFMVPRYVRVMDDIPKTATNKLRKVEIRDAGVTADTWDREAAGLHLKRERL